MNAPSSPIAVLAAGELLIDFISTDFAESLRDTQAFTRLQGGSPANLCLNVARLGHPVYLVATVGRDAMGDYLVQNVAETGLATDGIARSTAPTTLILVTRSREVSDFFPYRGADAQILAAQFPATVLERTRIFHTTCFALSREPARTVILNAAERVVAAGGTPSIDLNYAGKIWPDRAEAQAVVARYLAHGALVKCSEVDYERLYGVPLTDPEAAIRQLLALGAKTVVVTLGERGSYGSDGGAVVHVPVQPVEIVDTTGAGDAFWSGFLSGQLDNLTLQKSLEAGTRMAGIKLKVVGPLQQAVGRNEIY